ncbi:ectoine utilization protein EutA [Azospirillum sp. TSO35-2]|uniref:ectoine utilization protein EutA n=1 Tax=Azospirillum sp. TSO35-2 TaxID=716796 RepID=UPI000D60A6F8|nr:ectoine utilization protein EutA [Azospirillum sp. TSO35-2]PWC32850.1 arylmalonate decarboxylase [Azospirillum sp. TSO35-2]
MPSIPILRSATTLAFDDRPFERRVGLVVLATDHTTEPDFRRMVAGERIGVYTARIAYANPTTPENLRRMQPRLAEGAALILPDEPLDAICYSCTSASVVMGDDAIEDAIASAKPGVPVITPPAAARRALKALGARRIAVLTPYTEQTSRPMAAYFSEHGFDLARFTCFGLDDDREMARITPDSLVRAAADAMAPDADALFISCTALRSAAVAAEIEAAIGRPVVTSNQATAWVTLRLCGDDRPRPEGGRLMTLPLPAEAHP